MMELSQAIVLLVLIVLLGLGLNALVLLCRLLFPALIERTRLNAERMPIRSFLVGLVNSLFFGVIAAALSSSNSVARAISLLVVTLLLSYMAIGLAAVAELVGSRLRLNNSTPFRNLLGGVVLLEIAALVPIVGWFAVMPATLLIGYGATVIALIRRRPSQNQAASTSPLD